MYDLRPFIREVRKIVDRHYLGETGKYSRWLTQDENNSRDLGCTPYGSANAANILYTINEFPGDSMERAAFIKVLQEFQNKETGIFEDSGNVSTHSTAFISGALALFDSKPLYKATGLSEYATKTGIHQLLESIDWKKNPWGGSHLGSGIYASMILTDTVSDEWEDYYFEWLDNNVDPKTGLWKKGDVEDSTRFDYLAGTFHYVFNYEYAKRKLPYPKELLETCIKAYRAGTCPDFSSSVGWIDIDFTYLLAVTQRRSGIMYDETQAILKEIADAFIPKLLSLNPIEAEELNDMHNLFAVVCALSVLQDALPGYIKTSKPLQLVLEKRPFL